jgi:hypothetical protein
MVEEITPRVSRSATIWLALTLAGVVFMGPLLQAQAKLMADKVQAAVATTTAETTTAEPEQPQAAVTPKKQTTTRTASRKPSRPVTAQTGTQNSTPPPPQQGRQENRSAEPAPLQNTRQRGDVAVRFETLTDQVTALTDAVNRVGERVDQAREEIGKPRIVSLLTLLFAVLGAGIAGWVAYQLNQVVKTLAALNTAVARLPRGKQDHPDLPAYWSAYQAEVSKLRNLLDRFVKQGKGGNPRQDSFDVSDDVPPPPNTHRSHQRRKSTPPVNNYYTGKSAVSIDQVLLRELAEECLNFPLSAESFRQHWEDSGGDHDVVIEQQNDSDGRPVMILVSGDQRKWTAVPNTTEWERLDREQLFEGEGQIGPGSRIVEVIDFAEASRSGYGWTVDRPGRVRLRL